MLSKLRLNKWPDLEHVINYPEWDRYALEIVYPYIQACLIGSLPGNFSLTMYPDLEEKLYVTLGQNLDSIPRNKERRCYCLHENINPGLYVSGMLIRTCCFSHWLLDSYYLIYLSIYHHHHHLSIYLSSIISLYLLIFCYNWSSDWMVKDFRLLAALVSVIWGRIVTCATVLLVCENC